MWPAPRRPGGATAADPGPWRTRRGRRPRHRRRPTAEGWWSQSDGVRVQRANARNPPMATTEAKKPRAGAIARQWTSGGGSVGGRPRGTGSRRCPGRRAASRARPRGDVPGGGEAARPHQGLPQRRAEREAEVETQRVVAERLADPVRRREVGERGDRRHKEGRLRDPKCQPECDDRRQRVNLSGQEQIGAEQRAADEKRPSPMGVGEPAGERGEGGAPRQRTPRTPARRPRCRSRGAR